MDGFSDFVEELIDFEGFEEDGGEAFLAGADDGVVGVVAEAGHEDDGRIVADFLGGGEDFVAVFVWHFDVGEDQVVAGAGGEEGAGFGTVAGGVYFAAEAGEKVGDGLADVGLVVGDEDAFVLEDGVEGFAGGGVAAEDGFGTFGDFADAAADFDDVVEDKLETFAHVVVADVVVHEEGGFGGDVVEGAGDFGVDVGGELAGGGVAFDDEEVEDVDGDGDVAAEDFGELAVVLGERGGA